MKESDDSISERRRVLAAAREYRDRGYEVKIGPSSSELPAFLADFQVDLLAENGDDHVVVEVKTRESLARSSYLPGLAEVLKDKPGWRLDLVVMKPRARDVTGQVSEILSNPEVCERLAQASGLLDKGDPSSAMLLAWTATEATLRLMALRNRVRLKEHSPGYIVKQLYSDGLLDWAQYNLLSDAVSARNKLVHGLKVENIDAGDILRLIDLTERFADASCLEYA